MANNHIGLLSDTTFQEIADKCNASQRMGFGKCPDLIDCVLSNITPAYSAGFSAGGSIAAFVPTILALVGAAPLELVQIAFSSPPRALVMSLFGIGLPSGGLFRQLRRAHAGLPELGDRNSTLPHERTWHVLIPSLHGVKSWQYLLLRLLTDAAILGLGGLMVWRNYIINTTVMITWRCEYRWLVLAWPISCAVWMIIAICLLLVFKSDISISYPVDSRNPDRTAWNLMMLPYRRPRTRLMAHAENEDDTETKPCESNAAPLQAHLASQVLSDRSLERRGNFFIVKISMPKGHPFRNWNWYEAIIETLAVGIYLYATLVLTSTLFLSGEGAIVYAAVMVLCMSAVRILSNCI